MVDLEALSDLCTPWCIRVAATLRIADHIAAGIVDIDALAATTGSDVGALHNVLGHLVATGIFAEPTPGRFAVNDPARQLSQATPYLDLNGIGGRLANAWATLPTYVRTGKSTYHAAFGASFWDDLAAHPELGASFDALMGPAGHGSPDATFDIVGGWASIRTVVDVGGGTGSMLAEILRIRPHASGILVDLPGTAARAMSTFRAAGVSGRVGVVGQSFFDPLPSGADLYLLTSVLNDWPTEQTIAILRRCAEATTPSGRIVIIGGISADEEPRQLVIEMLLVGGVINSLTEFRHIARHAGLEVVAAQQQGGRFVVECQPIG